jgi:hypothetical protein
MRAVLSIGFFFLISIVSLSGTAYSQEGQVEMVGPLTQEEILQALPDWQDRMVAYAPKLGAVNELKAFPDFVQVEVYLGTWCSDSQSHVTAFFQVLNFVNSPQIQVSYMGVPKDKPSREPYIAGKDIEKLPTFIVLVNGIVKGRIVETPTRTVEEDLLALLRR